MLRQMELRAGMEPFLAVLVAAGWFIVKAILNRRADSDSWDTLDNKPAPRPHLPDRNQGEPPPLILKPSPQATTPPPFRRPLFPHASIPKKNPVPAPPVILATTAPPRTVLREEPEGPTRADLAQLKLSQESQARAAQLEKSVATRMAAIDQQTTIHRATVPIKRIRPVHAAQLVRNFRNPVTIRQAFLASFVLNPPKALEEK